VTTTGTGTSRTATASAGTPFAVTEITASATNTLASYLQTPQGLYQITARTSDTVVTISTLTTYVNEAAVAGTVWKLLFALPTSPALTTTIAQYDNTTTQPAFTVTALTKLGGITFVTSTGVRTVTTTYNGTTRNTHLSSPLAVLHNQLGGLQGGTATENYHLTDAEYTGTGTGNFVRATAPTLVTPALGTPSALVGTNITGTATAFTASNVTTNANLTGPITSVGNATSIASQTGTGTKFVVDTSPTLVTPTATTTIGVGNATPSASGAGITFPATASLSTDVNTLDDYEEGLFTAAITPETSGTITLIGGFDQLSYTKIGRTVLMQGQLKVDSVSLPVGTFVKISLPFAIASLSTVAGRFGTSVVSDINAGVNALFPAVGVSADSFVSVYLTAADVAANRSFFVGFSYTTTA
jgi:hypothetical protein